MICSLLWRFMIYKSSLLLHEHSGPRKFHVCTLRPKMRKIVWQSTCKNVTNQDTERYVSCPYLLYKEIGISRATLPSPRLLISFVWYHLNQSTLCTPLYCCYAFVIEYNTTQYVLPLFSPKYAQGYEQITRKYTSKYPCVFSQPPSLYQLLCQRPVTNFPSQAHTVHITYRVL